MITQLGFRMVAFILLLITGALSKEWSYRDDDPFGPKKWTKLGDDSKCDGLSQSPISINKRDVEEDRDLTPLRFIGYDKVIPADTLTMKNNGKTVEIKIPQSILRIEGAGLPTWYDLEKIEFHWGTVDNEGMEHEVGGKLYPLVMHLIHAKEGKREEAKKDEEGHAILAVAFSLSTSEKASSELSKITDMLRFINFKDEEWVMNRPLTLLNILPEDKGSYLRYKGSLTSPPCSETVIWTIFTDPVSASSDQLLEFRELLRTKPDDEKHEHIAPNARPIQRRNGRKIYARKLPKDFGNGKVDSGDYDYLDKTKHEEDDEDNYNYEDEYYGDEDYSEVEEESSSEEEKNNKEERHMEKIVLQ